MRKPGIDNLSMGIEELVREHIMATRDAAEAALRRAFSDAGLKWKTRVEDTARRGSTRRLKVELEVLSARLLEAVHARPGETMSIWATEMGAKPRALLRPMAWLKQTEKVKAVGHRNQTRYFPLT